MEIKAADENTLRKYLLGDVSPTQQEELELWLISEEQAYDLLVAAEDDLIDDWLTENLKSSDVERFNNHFLASPQRRRKLQFAACLQRFLSSAPQGDCV